MGLRGSTAGDESPGRRTQPKGRPGGWGLEEHEVCPTLDKKVDLIAGESKNGD